MLGLKYLNDLADRLGLPLVVCITTGTNMGGHIGTLPFPYLIEGYSTRANRITVIGTGNEADKRHHYYNVIAGSTDSRTVELRVGENVSGFSLELWSDIPNVFSISMISPSGESTSRIPFRVGAGAEIDFLFEKTKVSVDYRLLVEKSTSELVFFRFQAPRTGYLEDPRGAAFFHRRKFPHVAAIDRISKRRGIFPRIRSLLYPHRSRQYRQSGHSILVQRKYRRCIPGIRKRIYPDPGHKSGYHRPRSRCPGRSPGRTFFRPLRLLRLRRCHRWRCGADAGMADL